MQSGHDGARCDVQYLGYFCIRQIHIVAQNDDLPLLAVETGEGELEQAIPVCRFRMLLGSGPRLAS